MSGQWPRAEVEVEVDKGEGKMDYSKMSTRDLLLKFSELWGANFSNPNEQTLMKELVGRFKHETDQAERDCLAKAKERGQLTFTLVEQDLSAPSVICEWIKANIETCPAPKLMEALDKAIRIRDSKGVRKDPD